ncbi:MAG: CaiB/BaiF CoA transferase family protein [Hyphomicrobiaceae bacterium]
MSFERPYEGLRVVDLSQGVAGPYCGLLLAQNGADVIKVEPRDGDWARHLGQQYGDHTAFSIPANMGKRSIVIDLKHEASRGIVDCMVAEADVFIEGFRPGVIDRLGYAYDRLKQVNPRLIYVSISGFGQQGPMRERPAMDPVLQAFTGFMAENKGPDGTPHRTPVIVNDMATGLYAMQAVQSTLYARRDGAPGRKIEVSLMEGSANIQAVRLLDGYREGPFRIAGAPSGTFKTEDGWLQLIVAKDHEFQKLCKALDWPDLAADPRFQENAGRREHADFLIGKLRELFATGPTSKWQAILNAERVQNEAVLSYREFAKHVQPESVGLISWLRQAGSDEAWPVPNIPGMSPYVQDDPYATSPTLGQHSTAVLRDVGCGDDEIARWLADGVVIQG